MVRVRTDIIDAYIFRRSARRVEMLQLRRTTSPLQGTWQPVMGHARRGESAVKCLWRELREETGLTRRSAGFVRAWALSQVHPYYLADLDAIVISPCFAVEVSRGWAPRLNAEHDDARWVEARRPERSFMWPGQILAVRELVGSLGRGLLNTQAIAIRTIG